MQKILRTRILPLLILIFLFQIPSYSASKKYFVITGKIVLESGDPGAGSVEIIKTGKGTTTLDIPKTGKFKLELEFFNEFNLNLQESPDISTKQLLFQPKFLKTSGNETMNFLHFQLWCSS